MPAPDKLPLHKLGQLTGHEIVYTQLVLLLHRFLCMASRLPLIQGSPASHATSAAVVNSTSHPIYTGAYWNPLE
jgi:hypothetical protein